MNKKKLINHVKILIKKCIIYDYKIQKCNKIIIQPENEIIKTCKQLDYELLLT